MSMTMFFKKGRIIWDEYLGELSPLSVEPKISFDKGLTYMSLLSQAVNLRTGSRVTDSSIKQLTNGWKQMDVGFSFTPYAIPTIVNHTITTDLVNGKNAGVYYYILRCINKDSPGLEETEHNAYDALNLTNNHSKVYKVVLTEKSNITLYVNYADYVSGIVLYEGYAIDDTTFPITLKLSYISNLCNSLLETIDAASNIIWLKNKFPFPNKGIIKINNEYIKYNNCSYIEKIEGNITGNFWKLDVEQRGYLNTVPAEHIVSNDPYFANVSVLLANHSYGKYGELPEKQFSKPVITTENLIQKLYFDEKEIQDLVINNDTELPSTVPTPLGQILYDDETVYYGKALKLIGNGLVDLDLNIKKTMSVFCRVQLEDVFSDINSQTSLPQTSRNDPVIFGNENSIWLKVSRVNAKPYLGYKNYQIISPENHYMSSIACHEYNTIGISWGKDINTNFTKFNIYLNGRFILTEITPINFIEFSEEHKMFLGGFKNEITNVLTNMFKGYFAEWRVYNTELSEENFKMIDMEYSLYNHIWCGKININNDSIIDYSDISGSNSINTYDPLFTLTYTFSSANELFGSGSQFSTVYDDTLLKAYKTSGLIEDSSSFTYPIDSDIIQLRFDMNGDGTGFTTPRIRNIALIISEGSVS